MSSFSKPIEKLGGNAKKLVIVKTSVKYEIKYNKSAPDFHFIMFCN